MTTTSDGNTARTRGHVKRIQSVIMQTRTLKLTFDDLQGLLHVIFSLDWSFRGPSAVVTGHIPDQVFNVVKTQLSCELRTKTVLETIFPLEA